MSRSLQLLCTFILVTFVAGCVHHHHHSGKGASGPVVLKKAGPPPHAPAHGYRHKHEHGVELVFDSQLGVYVVVGWKDHFFSAGRYYRDRILARGGTQDGLDLVKGYLGREPDMSSYLKHLGLEVEN